MSMDVALLGLGPINGAARNRVCSYRYDDCHVSDRKLARGLSQLRHDKRGGPPNENSIAKSVTAFWVPAFIRWRLRLRFPAR
jgi:hypothetical protein